jgi:hypothetical protein
MNIINHRQQPVDLSEVAWALTTRTPDLSITNVSEIARVSQSLVSEQRSIRKSLEERGVDTLRITYREARQLARVNS